MRRDQGLKKARTYANTLLQGAPDGFAQDQGDRQEHRR